MNQLQIFLPSGEKIVVRPDHQNKKKDITGVLTKVAYAYCHNVWPGNTVDQ